MSNFGLYKAFDEAGIDYEKTAVGDKYVYENMVANGHRIGGEQSGHIIFSKYATTGDGILTSLKLMEVMLAKKMPLSKLADPVTIYPQVLKNIRVHSKPEAQNDPDVQAAVQEVADLLGDSGRILVRESGTEPVIRVMVEEMCIRDSNQTLSVSAYNKLGRPASHGCVRVTAGDAKWIYDNCKLKTKVVIYSKSGYEPLKKPVAYKLPSWHKWDPTDPNMKYKCKQKGCH